MSDKIAISFYSRMDQLEGDGYDIVEYLQISPFSFSTLQHAILCAVTAI